jgi:hypothetical protein
VIATANVELFSNDETNLTLFNIEKSIENKKSNFPYKIEEVSASNQVIVPINQLITQLNTSTISANKTETIQIISQIGLSLLSLSLNETKNEKTIQDSFELINLLLSQPDEYLLDSQASNTFTK